MTCRASGQAKIFAVNRFFLYYLNLFAFTDFNRHELLYLYIFNFQVMKRIVILSALLLYFISGCKKEDGPAAVTGTVTINNNLKGDQYSGYYAYGFSFSVGRQVSTLDSPDPDVFIDNGSVYDNLIFVNNNNMPSFFKYGEYPDEASAIQAYKMLTSATVTQWVGIGQGVRPNQVWLYRSDNEHYSKLRVVNTKAEQRSDRDYAECTFEWDYQQDGTLTFPKK